MITHVIFHPIQKSKNTTLDIDYMLRIQMADCEEGNCQDLQIIPINITDGIADEGNTIVHTVSMNQETYAPVTNAAYSLIDGTATNNINYDSTDVFFTEGVTEANGVLTIPAGVISFNIAVPTIDDNIYTGDIPLTYSISVGSQSGLGQIINTTVPTTNNLLTQIGDNILLQDGDNISHSGNE